MGHKNFIWWRKLTDDQWVALFPDKPKAFQTIAKGLCAFGNDVVTFTAPGESEYALTARGYKKKRIGPISLLAAKCGVSKRTMSRYLPVFEAYGVVEVYRWRYRERGYFGAPAISIRVFRGATIPEDWSFNGGRFPVSAREAA